MRDIFTGETVYLKESKESVQIFLIDRDDKPFRYWFKNNQGEAVFAHRKHLSIRKPNLL